MPHSSINRQIYLKSRPNGIPQPEDFAIREAPIPNIGENQFLIRNEFLSADPAMRGWITDKSTYWPRIEIGDTMRAYSVGEVEKTNHPDYAVGEKVMGIFGWQDYAAVTTPQVYRKVVERDLPLSLSLGVMGLNGLTAYFGIHEVLKPKPEETVVVSTAAGGVGSAAGQMAKIAGSRVVGVTGGPDKVRTCLEEFGYDAAIDYKNLENIDQALAIDCPKGVDCFFDNTSGPIHDAVLRRLNLHGRIAICGTATYASWDPWHDGPRPERILLVKRATMRGFLTPDFEDQYEIAATAIAGWIRAGKLKYREDIQEGMESAPASIRKLYSGENQGKLIIRL
jgi:NADPH-dependent curcumin reductase CurA